MKAESKTEAEPMETESKTCDETMKKESTTGDETVKTQEQVVIYLLVDDHIEVEMQPLTMGDLCEIVGTDRKVADFVKQMPVTGLQSQKTGRSVISVLMLVEGITEQVQKQFAGIQCRCVLLGAEQLIIEWGGQKAAPGWVTILKTACVSLIILAGSAFTIMTYDQDVDVTGVFGRIYQLFVGYVPAQPGILEAAYAFGVAAGILLFFNPFVSAAKRKAPSPVEIEMEKYESDIRDTIVKMDNRLNKR